MEDPNWLLSTCAQASAAIIAVIGGFFVNRIMVSYSEKNGIINELNDINNKLNFKLHALGELNKKIITMDQEVFFEKCEVDIIKKASTAYEKGEDLDKLEDCFDEYYIKYNEHEREYDELKPYFDEKVDIIKKAFLFFNFNSNNIRYINENLEKFIIDSNIEAENYEIYKNVFKAMTEKNEKITSRVLSNRSYISHVSSKIDKLKAIPRLQKYEKYISSKEYLEIEIKFLEQQKEQLESKMNYFEKPKGLVWSILIFIYFSIVGIIYPMSLMPMSAKNFTYECKITVIGLFISGVVLVFTYLALSVKGIWKKP